MTEPTEWPNSHDTPTPATVTQEELADLQQMGDQDPRARVRAAAEVLADIMRRVWDTGPIPLRARRRFQNASLEHVQLAARGSNGPDERCAIAVREAILLAEAANEDGARATLREARLGSVGAAIRIAERFHSDRTIQGYFTALADGLLTNLKVPPSVRAKAAQRRAKNPEVLIDGEYGVTLAHLAQLESLCVRALADLPDERIAGIPSPRTPINRASTAELIAATPANPYQRSTTEAMDRAEARLLLREVTFSGFRGSPNQTSLSFVNRHGDPVSCIIMGDNGVGKSTIADAIEFVLQGRVGRSTDLASAIRPLATNQAVNAAATARAILSDGSRLERSVTTFEDGRVRADQPHVRPGFRLSPITLKRADILAFLDARSMSRGSVLFDYFPRDSSGMAQNLEDERVAWEDQLSDARTRRNALTAKLAGLFGVNADAILGRDRFYEFIGNEVVGDGSEDERAEAWEAIDEGTRAVIDELRVTYQILRTLKSRLEKEPNFLNPVAYSGQAAQLSSILQGVGSEMTTSFMSISNARHVESMEVLFGKSGPVSIDIVVRLINGRFCYPRQIFSEGYCDLLALLFFLAVAKESAKRGQAKVLVLDDVLQSVDSSIRLGAVGHLLREFSDWQLIITVHDRLWLEQLRALFRSRGKPFTERTIRSWSFDAGLQLESGSQLPAVLVRNSIMTGDVATICAVAGRHLERLCQNVSMRLEVSVTRRLDDKYTLGDLWRPCAKALKKTSLRTVVERLELREHLRNMVGAHENQWAAGLPLSDAVAFAEDVAALLDGLYCTSCDEWVSRRSDQVICSCGTLRLPSPRS